MKWTNLQYVQNILSSMSSDEVNSISDSTESMQVAEILKTTYFNIIARAGLPEHKKLFQLDAGLNNLQPVLMFIPEGIKSIEWLKYYNLDSQSLMYQYVTILPIQQFMDYVAGYNTIDTTVDTMTLKIDGETFLFNYKNDNQPRFCTVIKDFYVVFDSYNLLVETTLQSSNTQAFGETQAVWKMEDDFIPDLDVEQIPLLLNEAKSLAFFELKRSPHQKAEQEAKRQWSSLQKDKSIDNKPSYFDQLPDYGRRGPYRTRGPYFKW
jgi:hypothetical protein